MGQSLRTFLKEAEDFATEYTFSHLGLNQSLQKNVSMAYYEAGHMMYIHMPSLKKMKADLVKFIRSAM